MQERVVGGESMGFLVRQTAVKPRFSVGSCVPMNKQPTLSSSKWGSPSRLMIAININRISKLSQNSNSLEALGTLNRVNKKLEDQFGKLAKVWEDSKSLGEENPQKMVQWQRSGWRPLMLLDGCDL